MLREDWKDEVEEEEDLPKIQSDKNMPISELIRMEDVTTTKKLAPNPLEGAFSDCPGSYNTGILSFMLVNYA